METSDKNKELAIEFCNWVLKRRDNFKFKYTVANEQIFNYYLEEKRKEREQKEKEQTQ